MKRILGKMRKAIETYGMLKPNELVSVGVSGGKDSMALLHSLNLYRRFSPTPFDLQAITVDMGFDNTDFSPIRDYCRENGIPYITKETNIKKIVFDLKQEKSPCGLCANLRRGALHNVAIESGSTTVALGHHADDAVETVFMSLLFEGRFNCFSPVTYLDRKGINLIRPMIYVREKEIIFNDTLKQLPIVKSTCPNDGLSKRAEVKDLIRNLEKSYPKLSDRVIHALENKDQVNLWF